MKITPNTPRTGLATDTASARVAGANPGSANPSGPKNVVLSASARVLAALADGGHNIDMTRVAALSDAIAAGELKIDTSRIANGLIASARDLLK